LSQLLRDEQSPKLLERDGQLRARIIPKFLLSSVMKLSIRCLGAFLSIGLSRWDSEFSLTWR
jgi:hypothetical protein